MSRRRNASQRRRRETPERELARWEKLARMYNPEWSPKAKMYALLLEAACKRIRLVEEELMLIAREAAERVAVEVMDAAGTPESTPGSLEGHRLYAESALE